ncbi:MAG: DUF2059 domain-containing protein [Tagaea sp.]|nr:DUF2059 domain-containing protein [Tagaea sp.]
MRRAILAASLAFGLIPESADFRIAPAGAQVPLERSMFADPQQRAAATALVQARGLHVVLEKMFDAGRTSVIRQLREKNPDLPPGTIERAFEEVVAPPARQAIETQRLAIAAMYARHLDVDQMRQIAAFLEGPAGVKVVALDETSMRSSGDAATFLQRIEPRLVERLGPEDARRVLTFYGSPSGTAMLRAFAAVEPGLFQSFGWLPLAALQQSMTLKTDELRRRGINL